MFATEILSAAHSGQHEIQGFYPLAQSIEWELGQTYLKARGNRAFISDVVPVPFAINNDGNFSSHAAELLFARLVGDEANVPALIQVLEIGVGLGLFARFFLDRFRELCSEHGKDFYDRICYVAGDYSERMLVDVARSAVLSNHVGRYKLRVVDAMDPKRAFPSNSDSSFQAVFLNYLLDCLPAAVLQFRDDGVKQLCVRTCLARAVRLSDYTDLSVEDLAARARADEPAARAKLLNLGDLFVAEYDFRPARISDLQYGDFVKKLGTKKGGYIVHNYGAIQALESLLDILDEHGFILVNDYGTSESDDSSTDFEHQRYSGSTFVGVNFSLLKAYFRGLEGIQWHDPDKDNSSMHSRLVGRKLDARVVERFKSLFGSDHFEAIRKSQDIAQSLVNAERFEAALSAYQEALEQQPYNWMLLEEVAHFLVFGLHEYGAALELARTALRLNPACSSSLWDAAGHCLFCVGRPDQAKKAFLQAIKINPNDDRARYNLARLHAFNKDYEEALEAIAQALTMNRHGTYLDALLQKQGTVLAELEKRHHEEMRRLQNRVRRLGSPPVSPLEPHSTTNVQSTPVASPDPARWNRRW